MKNKNGEKGREKRRGKRGKKEISLAQPTTDEVLPDIDSGDYPNTSMKSNRLLSKRREKKRRGKKEKKKRKEKKAEPQQDHTRKKKRLEPGRLVDHLCGGGMY